MFQSKPVLKRKEERWQEGVQCSINIHRELIYSFSKCILLGGVERRKLHPFLGKIKMLNCHQTFPFKSVLEWVQLSFTVQLWRFGIMNDSETLWDRFSRADLNQAISAKWWPVGHPQTLHSMKVTQTFRNVLIHQSSGYAELSLLCTLGWCGKWKKYSNSLF